MARQAKNVLGSPTHTSYLVQPRTATSVICEREREKREGNKFEESVISLIAPGATQIGKRLRRIAQLEIRRLKDSNPKAARDGGTLR